MDFYQIAATILLPAAISFIVSHLNKRREKEMDFSYDYRKYILERRKETYVLLEKLLDDLKKMKLIKLQNSEGKYLTSLIGDFRISIKLLWLSPQIISKLNEIDKFVKHELVVTEIVEGAFSINTESAYKFYKLTYELEEIFFHDLLHLGDIKHFRENLKKSNAERQFRLKENWDLVRQ